MGAFLDACCFCRTNPADVVQSIHRAAPILGHEFVRNTGPENDRYTGSMAFNNGNVAVVLPALFFDLRGFLRETSKGVARPVFHFHVHDEDFWTMMLAENGELITGFMSTPDYFGAVSDEERRECVCDVGAVCTRLPGISTESVAKYFEFWEPNDLKVKAKAYPTDRHSRGDAWQVLDVMKALGLEFQIDDQGMLAGDRFRLVPKTALV